MENSKTFRKSGQGRFREVVVYESFPFKAFDWGQNFGVTNKEHYGMLWYFLEW